MKLLMFLAVWKRPKITEICFMGLNRLRKIPGYDINVLAVISEESMIPLCEKYDVDWRMTKNHPLGAKKNYGIQQALRKDFDYLIEIGSDDLLKDEILTAYRWDAPVLGLMDFVLLNTENAKCKSIHTNIPKYGAGRAIERRVLETCQLWNDSKIRGLDNDSVQALAINGFMQRGVKCEQPLAISLRSSINLWSYESMPGKSYSIDKALEGLSDEEVNAINSLIHVTIED